MGILEQIRSKFGRPGILDSVALTQALGDLNARINKNRADAAATEAAIPAAIIESIDGAAAERGKLQNLESEHIALVSAADATRRAIAEALQREQTAEDMAQWERAEAFATWQLKARVVRIENQILKLREDLSGLLEDDSKLQKMVPAVPYDWDANRLMGSLLSTVRAQLHEPKPGEAVSTISVGALVREYLAHLFRDRAKVPPLPEAGTAEKMILDSSSPAQSAAE
jgi:hypothetical protein